MTEKSTQSGGWLKLVWLFITAPFRWLIKPFRKQDSALPAPESEQQEQLPPPDTQKTQPSISESEAASSPVDSASAASQADGLQLELQEPPVEVEIVVEPEVPAEVEPEVEAPSLSFLERIRLGLKRGNSWLATDLRGLFAGGVDEDILEDLETQLLMADVGLDATEHLIDALRTRLEKDKNVSADQAVAALRDEMATLIAPCNQPLKIEKQGDGPFVLLVVGVNGVGKTTTIGKLAHHYRSQGLKVMLAAGDTFRAAAVEQLQVWGERNDIPVVAQHTGADSAAVIFDALESARAKGIDLLIADTAGRLHTQDNLMGELAKVKRVLGKLDDTAPHEKLLVVDGGTGQNALSQVQLFDDAVNLSGLAVTKLDGTAKGGVMFAIAKNRPLPIRFIGVGEAREDLGVFNADEFIQALFADAA